MESRVKPKRPAKKKCGARTHNGRICKMPAGEGTNHVGYGTCRRHGGNLKAHMRKAAGEEAMERALVMGMSLDVDPMEALLTCIRITAGEVVYTTDKVHALTEKQAVVRKKKTVVREGELDSYRETEKGTDVDLNIWIRARHEAMDRLARYSKMAIDCGIAERQVQVAEQTGQSIGRMLQTVMAELGLSERQKELAPSIIQKNLILLEATEEK